MKKLHHAIGAVLVVSLAVFLATQSNAQTGPEADSDPGAAKSAAPVPRAALLTERGRQLAEELRLLKRSRESMGAKHPTLPLINTKIAAIEEQLQAWEPSYGEPAENPFHPNPEKPQMNEYDLRQIVIQLNKRVEQLEKRVTELESR